MAFYVCPPSSVMRTGARDAPCPGSERPRSLPRCPAGFRPGRSDGLKCASGFGLDANDAGRFAGLRRDGTESVERHTAIAGRSQRSALTGRSPVRRRRTIRGA